VAGKQEGGGAEEITQRFRRELKKPFLCVNDSLNKFDEKIL
jgi:hypothetical protein